MSRGAYVGSLDAVREFRAALCTFAFEAREALGAHDLEVRRALDWLLEDCPRFWQQAIRRSEDDVVQAKIELERHRTMRLPGGETPSCMVERKALERARRRREYAKEKAETVRKWGAVAGREATEYSGRANQLTGHLDAALPQAINLLDRALAALESYAMLKIDHSSAAIGERVPLATAEPPIAEVLTSADTIQDAPNDASATGSEMIP